MNGFPSVTIEFDGASYDVPSDKVWGLINAIEQHATFMSLATRMARGDVSRTQVCSAFAGALSYASGKRFSPQDVSEKLPIDKLIQQANVLLEILGIAESPAEVKSPGKPRPATTPRKKKG